MEIEHPWTPQSVYPQVFCQSGKKITEQACFKNKKLCKNVIFFPLKCMLIKQNSEVLWRNI